jgi:hypothetical protein
MESNKVQIRNLRSTPHKIVFLSILEGLDGKTYIDWTRVPDKGRHLFKP